MKHPQGQNHGCGRGRMSASSTTTESCVMYVWLAQALFDSIKQERVITIRWLWTYTHERRNMALGGITPAQKWCLPPTS